ncbi:MAG: plastocyanin/azurin family copper-binding protein [Gammaproteobacteria bacterium]
MWTFTRDGTVEYACHDPGHFAAGMVGKIVIVSPRHHG